MTFPDPYRARPARRDDLDALVELHEARDLVDVGFVDQARDEILVDWAATGFEFERDSVVAEANDGSIAAYGIVLALDPSMQIFAMGKVHPEHAGLGLGSALLAESERRATSRLAPGVSAPFRTGAPDTDRRAVDLFERRGYRPVRSFWHMHRGLSADDVSSGTPEGVTLRLASADDERLVRGLLEEAFVDHFGFEPMTFEEWQHEHHGDPGYDPSLMVLAYVGDEPAGASVNFAADDGAGWVGELGVLAKFRRRGVARALLDRSFAELAARGHHQVRLGVDIENTSGATHLYESVGMTVRRRYDVFEKRLTGA